MAMTRICEVRNSQLVIPMPKEYEKKTVRVVIDNVQSDHEKKVALMMQAANDPLFQSDVAEVMEDFKYVDREYFGENETVKWCSLGQITGALFEVGGQYRRNM